MLSVAPDPGSGADMAFRISVLRAQPVELSVRRPFPDNITIMGRLPDSAFYSAVAEATESA